MVVADEHQVTREAGSRQGMTMKVADTVDHDPGPLRQFVRLEEPLDPGVVVAGHDQEGGASTERGEHFGELAPLLPRGEWDRLLDIAEQEEAIRPHPVDQIGHPLHPLKGPAREVPPVPLEVRLDPEVEVGDDQGPLRVHDQGRRPLGEKFDPHAIRISPRRGM
ncbi:hypothetical protein DSECCO2_361160 [anaerobic digester metagenome]